MQGTTGLMTVITTIIAITINIVRALRFLLHITSNTISISRTANSINVVCLHLRENVVSVLRLHLWPINSSNKRESVIRRNHRFACYFCILNLFQCECEVGDTNVKWEQRENSTGVREESSQLPCLVLSVSVVEDSDKV